MEEILGEENISIMGFERLTDACVDLVNSLYVYICFSISVNYTIFMLDINCSAHGRSVKFYISTTALWNSSNLEKFSYIKVKPDIFC